MNLYRALFRLWVGGAIVATGAMLWVSATAPAQTNDREEFLWAAMIAACVGLFGAWVLRGLKGQTR